MTDDRNAPTTITVPNAVTYDIAVSPDVLAQARSRLQAQLDRAERQLIELESSLTGMLRDHDTIQEDRDGIRLVIDAIRVDVNQTKRALARIESGSYGRCTACASAIPPDRLNAIPAVERCARCA